MAVLRPLKNLHILLVGSDLHMQLYMRLLLKKAHCKISLTASRKDALQKFNTQIDGVLIDIDSCENEKFVLAKEMHIQHPDHNVLIYACSASSHDVVLNHCENGIQGFLPKPYVKNDVKNFLLLVSQKKNSSLGENIPFN